MTRHPSGDDSGGMTLIEVMFAAAITVLAFGVIFTSAMKGLEMGKWQSAYETAYSYGEQALEFALYTPYTNLCLTTSGLSATWVSNGFLVSSVMDTNYINTVKDGAPYVLTNLTFFATQDALPLDDLGSYVMQRSVTVMDRSAVEPAMSNLNYRVITVSNTWMFLNRQMPPIVLRTIRDKP